MRTAVRKKKSNTEARKYFSRGSGKKVALKSSNRQTARTANRKSVSSKKVALKSALQTDQVATRESTKKNGSSC